VGAKREVGSRLQVRGLYGENSWPGLGAADTSCVTTGDGDLVRMFPNFYFYFLPSLGVG
jgi:hypothetical protein